MKKMLKGFTLVEIMIVVAIIAILAAVAIPNFIRYRQTSQATACISNLKQIQSAYEQAALTGAAPADVAALVGADKYIKVEPKCPQTNTMTYSFETDGTPKCSNDDASKDAAYRHALSTESSGS